MFLLFTFVRAAKRTKGVVVSLIVINLIKLGSDKMAGHGRGRKIGYDAAISMSLDEVISVQKSEESSTAGVSRQQAESMSLGDIIVVGRGRGRLVNRGTGGYRPRPAPIPAPMEVEGDRIIPLGATLAQGSMRRYTDDVFKPLDEVVSTRGIPKPPPSYKNDRGNGALPITGRRNMTSGRESQASGNGTDSIGRAHSVDPLGLMQNGFEENRGNGNQRKRTFSDDEGAENETGLGQNTQKKQRVVSSDNIRGPFMAVQYLQQVGMNIKVRFALRSAKDQVPTRKWRAIVSSGSIQGTEPNFHYDVSVQLSRSRENLNCKNYLLDLF